MADIDDDTLQALIGDIYDAAVDPGKWTRFLGRWADCCKGSALIYTQGSTGAGSRMLAAVNIDLAEQGSYESYYSKVRPWLGRLAGVEVGAIFPITSWIDERTYRRSEYYTDFLARQDHFYELCGTLRRDDEVMTCALVVRPYRFGDFAARELQLAERLMPHLQRAVEMQRCLFAAEQRQQALLRGLDGLKIGVILAASDGRILFANQIAEDILRHGDALHVRQQHLQASTPALAKELSRHIHEAAHTGAGRGQQAGHTLSLRRRDGGQISTLICPFPIDAAAVIGPTVPTALVFMRTSDGNTAVRADDLTRLYGLTAAECKLVVALLAGTSLGDYARARGIGLETARTQLRHVFEKTGQHRQSDLVRHLLSNPIMRLAANYSSPKFPLPKCQSG